MNRFNRSVKKSMALLSLGGASFAYGISGGACARNGNYETLVREIGNGVIETVTDGAGAAIGSDFDLIFATPVENFLTGLWGNYVFARFPQDVPPGDLFKQ